MNRNQIHPTHKKQTRKELNTYNAKYLLAGIAIIVAILALFFGQSKLYYAQTEQISVFFYGNYTATLQPGPDVNAKMKELVNNGVCTEATPDTSIKYIKRSQTITSANSQAGNVVSTQESEKPVYMWYDGSDNTIYWYSEARVVNMNADSSYFYSNLQSLTSVDVGQFNETNVTNMSNMFSNCDSLEGLDLHTFDTTNVTNMTSMFAECDNLTTIYAGDDFVTTNVVSSTNMFANSTKLVGGAGTEYDANHIDATYARIDGENSLDGYFTKYAKLKTGKEINTIIKQLVAEANNQSTQGITYNSANTTVTGFERSSVSPQTAGVTATVVSTDDSDATIYMWYDSQTQTIKWYSETETVLLNEDSSYMFNNLQSIENIDLSGTQSFNVNNMSNMFSYCSSIELLNISNLNTANVTNMTEMFANCTDLETILVSNKFTTDSVTQSANMFNNCESLVGENGTEYNQNYKNGLYARVDRTGLPGYFSKLIKVTYNVSGVTFTNGGNKNIVSYYKVDGEFVEYEGEYEEPESNGTAFIGWNTESDGSGTTYDGEDEILEELVDDLEVYGKYGCKIIYNANGGSFNNNKTINKVLYTRTLVSGNTYSIENISGQYTLPTTSPQNQFFNYWNTQANGKGTTYTESEAEAYVTANGGILELYAIYYSGAVIRVKDATGENYTQVVINKENVSDYIGMKVNYAPQGGGSWRLFYIDFDGKYEDENSTVTGKIYLKRDYDEELRTDLRSHSTNYTPGAEEEKYVTAKEMLVKLNPLWAENRANAVTWNSNEKSSAYLCDIDEWEDYKTNDAEYAIGGPSLEMYVNAVKQKYGNLDTYKLNYTYAATNAPGYKFQSTNGLAYQGFYWFTDNNVVPDEIVFKGDLNKDWWLASPAASNAYRTCRVLCSSGMLDGNDDSTQVGVCPVAAIYPTTTLYTDPCAVVSFNANGGSGSMGNQFVQVGDKLRSNTFTKTNYSFAGWNTAADGSGTGYTDEQVINNVASLGNVTLYAQWERISYTITFDASTNGGSINYGSGSKQVYAGDEIGEMPFASKDGGIFYGWFDAASGGNEITENIVPTGNVTYYAQYERTAPNIVVSNYGEYVDLGTSLLADNNQTTLEDDEEIEADWRIFLNRKENAQGEYDENGEDYVYLILADYLYVYTQPGSAVVSERDLFSGNSSYPYRVYYSGTNGSQPLKYRLENDWSRLLAGTTLSTYYSNSLTVTGAIDLIKWIESWNANDYTQLEAIYVLEDVYGYGVSGGYSNGVENTPKTYGLYAYVDETGYLDTLYFPHKSDLNNCYGYWLASVSATDPYASNSGSTALMCIDYRGKVTSDVYDSSYYGVRPVVRLPANILKKDGSTWSVITLNEVTYNANGGTFTENATTNKVTYNDSTITSGEYKIPTYTNKAFSTWNTKADGTGTSYTEEQIENTYLGKIMLFAQYVDGYRVSFNSNGGKGTMWGQTILTGDTENLTANTFTRAGYRFTGWNTQADGSGTSYTDEQSVTDLGNVTLYAQWEGIQIGDSINYSITLNNNTLDNWRVFINDENDDDMYLIYGAYLPNTAVSVTNLTTSNNYAVNADSRPKLLKALLTESNWSSLLNTNLQKAGATATGAPTIEQYVKSWNAKHPDELLYTTSNGFGSFIGTEENPSTTSVTKSVTDDLYYPYTSTTSSTYGYWIASPSAQGSGVTNVMREKYDKTIAYESYSSTYYAARPIIRIPKAIIGTYQDSKYNLLDAYSITYNLNDGSISDGKSFYTSEDGYTLPTPTKAGNVFLGWTGDNGDTPELTVTIPAGSTGNKTYTANWSKVGPQVGDTVTYSPSGSTTVDDTYSKSSGTSSQSLSASDSDYNITSWKILNIDETTGEIQLVPSQPTTGTLTLDGAQGYNNGVKILNDVCSDLYADASKGITARSINEEDFVKYGGEDWVKNRSMYTNTSVNVLYGGQKSSAISSTTYNYYPSIYAQEANRAIGGSTLTADGLKQSEPATNLIDRTGYLRATIHPLQTYYTLTNSVATNTLGILYSNLLIPQGTSTSDYWIASRCINYYNNNYCNWGLYKMASGVFGYSSLYTYNTNYTSVSSALFPVVTIPGSILGDDGNGGYEVLDSYKVTYTLDGGSIEEEEIQYIPNIASYTLPTPTKTGYTFTGWTGSNGETPEVTVTIPAGNTTDMSYTANWIGNTIVIEFDSNGGTGTMANQNMTYDVAANLTANQYTKNGKFFYGWNTESDGSGDAYSDCESVENLKTSGTIILYAQWVDGYTVTFNASQYGGTVNGENSITTQVGQGLALRTALANLPTAIPNDANKVFIGWYISDSPKRQIDLTEVPTENITYYALYGVNLNNVTTGDTVYYTPQNATYDWNARYATGYSSSSNDYQEANITLDNTDSEYQITTWKILSVDVENNGILIVPETISSGTVTLHGAMGYNNGVYLLNEACNVLYGNTSSGIVARNIREEDFVEAGGNDWIVSRSNYQGYKNYGSYSSYGSESNRGYPLIYPTELNSVLNGTENTSGISGSVQNSLLTGNTSAGQADSSIRPYQTFYNVYDTASTDEEKYLATKNVLNEFGDILLQNEGSTDYWVASRCINLYSSNCVFDLRCVKAGYFEGDSLYGSHYWSGKATHALCPVVYIGSEMLTKTGNGEYSVNE